MLSEIEGGMIHGPKFLTTLPYTSYTEGHKKTAMA